LRLNEFEKPQLLVNTAETLSLSNIALLDLMRAVLNKDVPFRFHAKGNSMVPFIRNGDIITISPLLVRKPQFGDIVAFVHPHTEQLVVHRVIGRRNGNYLIKGDASSKSNDGLIPFDSLLGRVTTIQRNGRRIRLGLGFEKVFVGMLSHLKLVVPIRKLFTSINQRIFK